MLELGNRLEGERCKLGVVDREEAIGPHPHGKRKDLLDVLGNHSEVSLTHKQPIFTTAGLQMHFGPIKELAANRQNSCQRAFNWPDILLEPRVRSEKGSNIGRSPEFRLPGPRQVFRRPASPVDSRH